MPKDFEDYVNIKERIDLILQRKFDSLFGFFNEDGFSFYRDVPGPLSPKRKVNITSTCFCALAILDDESTGRRFLSELTVKKGDKHIDLRKMIAQVLRDTRANKQWILEENLEDNHNNVYTASIATTTLRLLEPNAITPEDMKEAEKLLGQIADDGAVSYGKDPPHAFLAFWCACALRNVTLACKYQKDLRTKELKEKSEELKEKSKELNKKLKELEELEKKCFDGLRKLWNWAEREVNKQIAYNASEEIDKFDAAQLAYSLAMLELLWNDPKIRSGLEGVKRLELGVLKEGIDLFFKFQRDIGLWPKFGHIMHTQEQGSIYPFAFQMLDALLSIIDQNNFELFEKHLDKLSYAIRWVEENKIEYSYTKEKGEEKGQSGTRDRWGWGWRSNFLPHGQPQSWSTAAVFCAIAKMRKLLVLIMKDLILREFSATRIATPNPHPLAEIKDSTIPKEMPGRGTANYSLKKIIKKYFIQPRVSSENYEAKEDLKVSAIFFGPTGTRKTGLAKAIAYAMGWDFVKIYMGDFLVEGESNVAARAGYIFRRLKELEKAVILIDEVEELVRKREGGTTALSSRLLTTSMLPLLEELHNNKRIMFIATTNYIGEMDTAAIRRGRFDLRLRITPPNRKSKIQMTVDVWEGLKEQIRLSEENLNSLKPLVKALYGTHIQYFLYYEWVDFLNNFFGLFKDRPPKDRNDLEDKFTEKLNWAAKYDITFRTADRDRKKMRDNFDNLVKYIDVPPDPDCETDSP